ncbi:MAG TPA: hypothetical protein VGQ33_01110, partial [Vicinamibacteria bacterium]|nr:hypothetical protein [Vicinamibacteria bacterium]
MLIQGRWTAAGALAAALFAVGCAQGTTPAAAPAERPAASPSPSPSSPPTSAPSASPPPDHAAFVAAVDTVAADALAHGPIAGLSIAVFEHGRAVLAKG